MSSNSKANFFKATGKRVTTRLTKMADAETETRYNQPPERASSPGTPESDTPTNKSKIEDSISHTGRIDGDMFEEIRKMSATLQVVAMDVVSIKETTKELKDSVENVQIRLGEAEQRISEVEDVSARMEENVGKCDKKLETLWTRVEDLENRSRRNNVRMVGLKEGKEETGKVIQYVEKVLSQGLGLTGNEFEIERAHRSFATMPNPDEPPRTVMIRFLRSSARDKVLQVAKEKRGIKWEDCKLSFFEDLSRELVEKRKAFIPVKRRLHELNVRHRLVYPATLFFTWKGQKKTFRVSTEAEKFVRDLK